MENPENAWTWQEIINSLRNRWINDIIFACVDWLKWFKWAILSNFPNAIIQPCIVHKIRNLQKLISYKDRYEFNLEFKKVYNAISEEEALLELNKMNIKWQKYSHILSDWFYDIDVWWQYFKYSYRIRKLIYTTNIIENLNWIIQTNIAKRRVYFTHKSAEISIFLAIQNKQNSLKKISCSQELRLELINFFWERIPKI
jgi:transposase-like protein